MLTAPNNQHEQTQQQTVSEQWLTKHVAVSEQASKLVIGVVKRGQGKTLCAYMRQHGAFGSTTIRAHGTAQQAMLDLLGLENKERDLVMCFLPIDLADHAVDQVSRQMQMQQSGEGIVFSIPIDYFAGQTALMKLTRIITKKQQGDAMGEKGAKR